MSQPRSVHLDPACVEARGLALGLREAWRLRLHDADWADFRATFASHGWTVVRSERRFADRAGGLLREDPSGPRIVVVALDAEVAQTCLELELQNADHAPGARAELLTENARVHRELGRMYGYPPCCVDAFIDAHTEAILSRRFDRGDNALQLVRAAARSVAFAPLLRAFGQQLGDDTASPLRHMPCAFDCAASMQLAARLMDDLRTSNPPRHRAYLDAPIIDLAVLATGEVQPWADATAADGAAAGRREGFPIRLGFATRSPW